MFPTGEKPSFSREVITIEDVLKEHNKHPYQSLTCFIDFLNKLDWNKTAIFYEKEVFDGSGREGYRVVHFEEKVEEKWHNVWAQTWFGLGAWMS